MAIAIGSLKVLPCHDFSHDDIAICAMEKSWIVYPYRRLSSIHFHRGLYVYINIYIYLWCQDWHGMNDHKNIPYFGKNTHMDYHLAIQHSHGKWPIYRWLC